MCNPEFPQAPSAPDAGTSGDQTYSNTSANGASLSRRDALSLVASAEYLGAMLAGGGTIEAAEVAQAAFDLATAARRWAAVLP